jgi:hypothetical protein
MASLCEGLEAGSYLRALQPCQGYHGHRFCFIYLTSAQNRDRMRGLSYFISI